VKPLGSWQTLAIEKAEAPPPEGSHAMKRCDVLFCGLRTSYTIGGGTRLIMFSMSTVEKAFSEPSAEMPSDSRRSMAGSSAKSARTVSTFLDESQRGIEASLCRHFSGVSVFRHSSHTKVILMLSKM